MMVDSVLPVVLSFGFSAVNGFCVELKGSS